jgi:hypothetical protein
MKHATLFLLMCGAVAVACNDDATLLYDRGDDAGNGGASLPPPLGGDPMTTGSAGFGGDIVVEGGAPPGICPPPEEPVCECPSFETCFCDGQPEEPCIITCDEGCNLGCGLVDGYCSLNCEGDCLLFCDAGAFCEVSCGADCIVFCESGSYCIVTALNGPSMVECQPGAMCECTTPECICEGEGCIPTP